MTVAPCVCSQDAPTNGRGSQTAAAANKKETAHEEKSECHLEEMEKDADGKNEKMKSTERLADEDQTLGENGSNGGNVNKDKFSDYVCDSSVAEPEADVDTDMNDTSAVKTVLETSEDDKGVSESEAPAAEETNPCSSEGKAVVSEVKCLSVSLLSESDCFPVQLRLWLLIPVPAGYSRNG